MRHWTVSELLRVTSEYLSTKGSDSARLDAELLLAHVLGVPRVGLYTGHDRPVEPSELDAYRALVARRAQGEPVAYVLGTASFRYLDLQVGPGVLLPRPETEELVDAVLQWLELYPVLDEEIRIADVGTGSGAIALSLALEAQVRVLALDSSREALEYAHANRDRLDPGRLVEVFEGDLLSGVSEGSLQIVVSNPPYVSDREFEELAPGIREFEPAAALRGGADGLDVMRRLVSAAARALGRGGALFLEIGSEQGDAVADLLRGEGFSSVEIRDDLAGRTRIARGQRLGAPRLAAGQLAGRGSGGRLRRALAAGALVGVPTDTVYGLACDWRSALGVRRMYGAKVRGEEQPVAVLFPSVQAVIRFLPDLGETSERVLEELLPGPYTFVVHTRVERPPLVGTEESLGVRVPDHPVLLRFLQDLGVPLAATSANRTGEDDPLSLDEVDPEILSWCAVGIEDSGREARGVASSVVDLRPLETGEAPVVLREGAVPGSRILDTIENRIAGD